MSLKTFNKLAARVNKINFVYMQLPDLQRIGRIAMARCTREAKFEAVQRHYIKIYQSNFFMLYKIYPRLTYVKVKKC